MFFSRGCNRGKSRFIVQDYEDFVDEDGRRKRRKVTRKVNLVENSCTQSINERNETAEPEEIADDFEFDYADEPDVNSDYQKRREGSVKNWECIREKLVKAALEREGSIGEGYTCTSCKADTATFRCKDCGGSALLLCEVCCDSLHGTVNVFHCPERWDSKNEKWERFLKPKELLNPYHNNCDNGQEKIPLTLLDSKGTHHEELLNVCNCKSVMETLVYLHFWPATPCTPSLAFSIDLLLKLQALMFECHISVYDFVKHLSFYSNPLLKKRQIYEQLLDSFEEFRYHYKAMESVPLVTHEGNVSIEFKAIKCLACPDGIEETGDIYLSADACFGLPRKKSSGASFRKPLSSGIYFINQSEVDAFMKKYPKSTTCKDRVQDCSDFQAGSLIRSKGRYVALDETAVFGLTCRHSFPWKFLNLKGGERIGYMVYLLTQLIEQFNCGNRVNLKVMYDICCQLEKHLKNNGRTDILSRIQLACPQFHAYGHGADCQYKIRYSPRRLPGWGLCDGEVMERLWSYLGKFKKMTKEMSSSHREDILSDALCFHSLKQKNTQASSIVSRYKNSLKVQKDARETLQDIREVCPITLSYEVLQKWHEEERVSLLNKQAPKVNLLGNEWIVVYFQLLRKFYALRESVILLEEGESFKGHLTKLVQQLSNIEKTRGIRKRWKPTDPEFQSALVTTEATIAKTTLDLLRMSGRRRWFLLSLIKKYADGQAQAYRLTKAIAKESKTLKQLLKKYNASVQVLKEHGHQFRTLSWEEAADVTESSLYTRESSQGSSLGTEALVSETTKREALDVFCLLQRAGEEMATLEREMSCVTNNLYKECLDIDRRLTNAKEKDKKEIYVGLRSVISRKIDYCQAHLYFAVESFKDHITIPEQIVAYLHNYVLANSQENQFSFASSDCDLESVDEGLSGSADVTFDETESNEYLFEDEESGYYTLPSMPQSDSISNFQAVVS